MATRVEQLEKAKAAKAAKAAGTVGAFVAESKQKKKSVAGAGPHPDATPAQRTEPDPSAPPIAQFANLANLRPSRAMGGLDDPDEVPGDETTLPGTSEVETAQPAETPAEEIASDRGVVQTKADARQTPRVAANPPHQAPAPRFPGLAATAPRRPPVEAGRDRRSESLGGSATHEQDKPIEPDPNWDQPTIPAGSHYSLEQWSAAREASGGFHVFEVRSGREGALVQVPAARVSEVSKNKVVVNGHVGMAESIGPKLDANSVDYIDPMMGLLLDGCLLLGPKAPTTHPAAATGLITIKMPDGKDWSYRIVRPASHREDENLAWLFLAKGSLPLVAPVPKDARVRLLGESLASHRNVGGNESQEVFQTTSDEDPQVVRERMTG